LEDFPVVFEFSNTPPPGSPHALAHHAPKASIYRHVSEHMAQGTNLYLGCHYLLICLRYAVVFDSFYSLMRGYCYKLSRNTSLQLTVDQSPCHSTLHSLNFEDSVVNKPQANFCRNMQQRRKRHNWEDGDVGQATILIALLQFIFGLKWPHLCW
jgi:hypothetical protein